MARTIDWTDEDLLELMHRREALGQTFGAIAEHFTQVKRVTVSRSACIGLVARINAATDDAEADGRLPGPEHDGRAGDRWWAARDARRAVA